MRQANMISSDTIAALATVMMLVTLGVMLLIEKTLGLQTVV